MVVKRLFLIVYKIDRQSKLNYVGLTSIIQKSFSSLRFIPMGFKPAAPEKAFLLSAFSGDFRLLKIVFFNINIASALVYQLLTKFLAYSVKNGMYPVSNVNTLIH